LPSRLFREALWNSYVEASEAGSISYGKRTFYWAKEGVMLELALFAAFVLLCLYLAYERLTHRL
jgi:hypothetical protein